MTIGAPVFNFVNRRGSVTSVKTFTRGLNCGLINYEQDTDNIYNKVQVLGYGSGINQIKSDIKEDATSQSTYGIREKTITDRNITTKSVADLYAAYVLDYYKNPQVSFVVQVPFNQARTITTGDNITIIDNKLGINGDYRIKNIVRNFGISGDYLNLEVSNKQKDLLSVIENNQDNVKNDQEITQGDTIRQSEDFDIVCSSSAAWPDEKAAYLRFTSPSGGVTTINDLSANINVTKFRVPISSGSVGSGGEANYTLNNVSISTADTSSAGGASVTNGVGSVTNDAYSLSNGNNSIWNTPQAFAYHTQMLVATGTINVLNSSLSAGWNSIIVWFADYGGTARSASTTLRCYKSGHTHGMDHTHVGPQHTHPITGGYTGLGGDSNTSNSSKDPTDSSNESYIPLSFTVVSTYDFYNNGPQFMVTCSGAKTASIYLTVSRSDLHVHSSPHPASSHSTGTNNIAHADHEWSYVDGIGESSLPGSISYTAYFGPTSTNPEDDETEAWQTAATNLGTVTTKTHTFDIISEYAVFPNTKYTLKLKPTADLGFQVNLQSTHFNDETNI